MCRHKKITPFSSGNFCPDCGKEIKITWIILRCSCCQTKRKACLIFNSIVPIDKYCIKCGDTLYTKEKKETIDFTDINYAIISKKEVANPINNKEILQIWVENEHKSNDILHSLRLIPLLAR